MWGRRLRTASHRHGRAVVDCHGAACPNPIHGNHHLDDGSDHDHIGADHHHGSRCDHDDNDDDDNHDNHERTASNPNPDPLRASG